ncbi:phosphatase PAP2 family protein [Flavobacteriaceae bacterium]|nr:phosphatase PAP2 family protein [Flavobacteriaceae bacterium]MDA9886648.1 phosphatase PAP2 family protein [Flavobacteriaceae bacterium]MDB4186686.1 phosphatase PAP2 family protein [Flavobacteriaceae bacterium]MDC0014018.1 phosphatase PAP2 family protein [Flavobacteriaceae bacterium]MDC1402264.1 phosphatase PAP2 family protein [Flavobacteriaceae bacterium]
MLEQLLLWDETLFLYLNQLGSTFFDPFWLLLSEKATNAVVYLFIVFVYGRKHGWKSAFFLLLIGAAVVGVTDQVTNGFKYGFMRLRPCHTPELQDIMRLVKDSCGGKYSFFSGHSSNSFALALFFSLVFKRIKWLMPILLSLAVLIAYSRVYLGVHFPLDIICGAFAGLLIASLVYSLVNKRATNVLPPY